MISQNQDTRTLKTLLKIAVAALFLAVLPIWPYGYYTLLRLVVCGVCIFFVVKIKNLPALKSHKAALIVVGILFNPLIPVYLVRTIWLPIDIGTGIYLIILVQKLGALYTTQEITKGG